MVGTTPWSIHISDLAPVYERIEQLLLHNYGPEAAVFVRPVGAQRLALLERQLEHDKDAWQDIIRGRLVGLLTLVYYQAINERHNPGDGPLKVTPTLHATGIQAQLSFLRAVAMRSAQSHRFTIADVRAVWFEKKRRPIAPSLKAEAAAYAKTIKGEPKYGPTWHYTLDAFRFFIHAGRKAAYRVMDDLEMALIAGVLNRRDVQRLGNNKVQMRVGR